MAVQMQPSFVPSGRFEKLKFVRYESVDTGNMPSAPPTPLTPSSAQEYEIQIATENDKEDILNFLRTFFFKDEPLNKYLELINDEHPRCLELEAYALKNLPQGICLKAVQNGELIGVSLNGILERGHMDKPSEPVKHEKFSIIVGLLERVAKDVDIFSKFPDCDKAATVDIISVNEAYRGKGIARELMAKTKELAKAKGCGFMTVDCTSHFTACALKKLGFKLVYSLKYADYEVDGKTPLLPEAPHEAVTVYTQRID